MKAKIHSLTVPLALLALFAVNTELSVARAQGTAFSYQGLLQSNAAPVNGYYDFQIKLYLDNQGNTQAGTTVTTNAVPVTNGLFMLSLNFGSGVFDSSNYWMQLGVRSNNVGGYTDLNPLQPVTPTPYAIYAENGAAAQSLSSGVAVGSGSGDTIGSGDVNSFIGGGLGNVIQTSVNYSIISGGDANTIQSGDNESFIGGGTGNTIGASSPEAAIVGGSTNSIVNGQSGFIGGGSFNAVSVNMQHRWVAATTTRPPAETSPLAVAIRIWSNRPGAVGR